MLPLHLIFLPFSFMVSTYKKVRNPNGALSKSRPIIHRWKSVDAIVRSALG